MFRLSVCLLILSALILAQPQIFPTDDLPPGTPLGSRPDIGPEYFQQGVHYRIEARLDTETDLISGTETLTYRNNSSDTLRFVYFHLFQKAFQPGSLQDERRVSEGNYSLRNLEPGGIGDISVEDLVDGSGTALVSTLSDTRLRVLLSRPLPPGGVCRFSMSFQTRFGDVKRRMHKGSDYYVGTQWYPRIAVYDTRRGWNIDPHLGHEFYGDFGTFDWSLTLPADYIAEGTGLLTNRDEVLPPDLMAKLDIRNFKDKAYNSPAGVVIPPTDSTKTWRFHAENVHDIAWIASPDFRIGTARWEGITVYALAREQHAAKWQDAAEIGARFVADYSRRWGRYRYHKMIVSDVDDGMEYPMLTADSGSSPGYIGLLGHEIGHNWFYGQIGSNETYRAFLDEGFTNYITCTSMDSIWGPGSATPYEGWYAKKFYPRKSRKYIRNDWRYLKFIRSGYEKLPLNTHSDRFDEYANYRLVYSKTTSMLFALEAVLGRSVVVEGMQTYFKRFLFQHPYPEDFVKVLEQVSDRRLDWFFEQWLNTTRQLDYAVTGLKNLQSRGREFARISLRRVGDMAMPLDLKLELKDGSYQMIHIPNRFDQVKPLPADWFVTRPWLGWQRIRPEFTFTVPVTTPARRVTIDPSGRLMDVNRLNNRSGFPKLHWQVDNLKVYYPTLDAYDIYLRPGLLYNRVDGLKPGLHWTSGYLVSRETRQDHIQAELWYAAGRSALDYAVFYETPLRLGGPLAHVYLRLDDREGRVTREIGLSDVLRQRLFVRPYHEIKLFYRESKLTDDRYIPGFQTWQAGDIQTLNFRYARFSGNSWLEGSQTVTLEAAVPGSDFLYTQQSLQIMTQFRGLRALRLRGLAARQTGEVPAQFGLRLGGARFFDAAEQNWLYRSAGSLGSSDWLNARLQPGGGGNVRSAGETEHRLKWLTGINAEYDLPLSRLPVKPLAKALTKLKLKVYLFGTYMAYDRQGDGRGALAVSEAGGGIYLPLKQIPDKLGTYGLRVDRVYFTSGGDFDARTVLALERAW